MFNLTREERQVLLFLLVVALAGMIISCIVKTSSRVRAFVNSQAYIGKLDLNSVDKDALIAVPGIGEKLAQRILEYRSNNSGFKDIEELKNIKGITQYRYSKFKDYLIVKQ